MFFGISKKYLKSPSLYLTMLSFFYLLSKSFSFIILILLITLYIEHIIPSDIERVLFVLLKNRKRKNNHTKYIIDKINKSYFYRIFYLIHIPCLFIIEFLLIIINQMFPLTLIGLQFLLNLLEILYIKKRLT